MRAKIIIKTDLLEEDIQARLKEHSWWPEFNQDSQDALDIKQRILNTIAENHYKLAAAGAKFVLLKPSTETEGLIGTELGNIVIRISNSDVPVLQADCEELVRLFYRYCALNKRPLEFVNKVEILEVKNHNIIIEGRPIPSSRALFQLARTHKKLELSIGLGGLTLLILSLLISFPWPVLDVVKRNSAILAWLFDLPNKSLGAILIATISASLNFLFHYNELKNKSIVWNLPQRTS